MTFLVQVDCNDWKALTNDVTQSEITLLRCLICCHTFRQFTSNDLSNHDDASCGYSMVTIDDKTPQLFKILSCFYMQGLKSLKISCPYKTEQKKNTKPFH